ncbi:MAG: hypothetical protein DRJ32_06980, partial [Thermoprotei archaeon]
WYDEGSIISLKVNTTYYPGFPYDIVFEGWYINSKMTTSSPTLNITVNSPMTIEAKWSKTLSPYIYILITVVVLAIAIYIIFQHKRKFINKTSKP